MAKNKTVEDIIWQLSVAVDLRDSRPNTLDNTSFNNQLSGLFGPLRDSIATTLGAPFLSVMSTRKYDNVELTNEQTRMLEELTNWITKTFYPTSGVVSS